MNGIFGVDNMLELEGILITLDFIVLITALYMIFYYRNYLNSIK